MKQLQQSNPDDEVAEVEYPFMLNLVASLAEYKNTVLILSVNKKE